MRLPHVRLVLGVRDRLQVVGVPAGEDAAAMMWLLALWDWAAQQPPAEPVDVAVLRLGVAPVRGGRPSEPPAGAQLRVGRFEDGAVKQVRTLRRRSAPAPGGEPERRACAKVSARDRPPDPLVTSVGRDTTL